MVGPKDRLRSVKSKVAKAKVPLPLKVGLNMDVVLLVVAAEAGVFHRTGVVEGVPQIVAV